MDIFGFVRWVQIIDPDAWPRNEAVVLFAYITAGLLALVAYLMGFLSAGGAVSACAVGGTIFGFGGPDRAMLLVIFFVTSNALSFVDRYSPNRKRAEAMFGKGGRRDATQVLANGGVAALLVFLPFVNNSIEQNGVMLGAFCGTLAAATADTWATELGVLSPWRPRSIVTGRAVEPGTSGGVTVIGLAASVAGAALIGLAAVWLGLRTTLPGFSPDLTGAPFVQGESLFFAALWGGIAGSLADSLMGAIVQAQYRCPQCDKPTERRVHGCGTPTRLVRGVAWVNNDTVNALATAVGAVVGGVMWALLYN
jgi:uncharacterized protein (TIGR00297 family)